MLRDANHPRTTYAKKPNQYNTSRIQNIPSESVKRKENNKKTALHTFVVGDCVVSRIKKLMFHSVPLCEDAAANGAPSAYSFFDYLRGLFRDLATRENESNSICTDGKNQINVAVLV